MATPQTFKAIDSTAADPSQPGTTTAAQVSTAHLQMARQNNRYLIEWRGPTTTFTWPNTEPVNPEEDPPIYPWPRIAYATWACYGPFRYYVPDLNTDQIAVVDLQLFGEVKDYPVSLAAFSLQGHRGQPPTSQWLDDNSTTHSPSGPVTITISGVQVRAGWNDLYLCEQSSTGSWSVPISLWTFTDNFGSYPRIIAFGSDLSSAEPALLNSEVPNVAIRCGVLMDDKDAQFEATTPFTVAYSCLNDAGDSVSFVYLAEVYSTDQIPTSSSINDYGSGVFYSAQMGVLELYSLSITPYSLHPNKANDPMLRWYQLTGSNVADVYWQGNRLNDLRQTQVGSAKVPKQEFITWPGGWKVSRFNDTDLTELVREVALTVRTEQPTEGAGEVSIEVSLPAMLLEAAEMRSDSYQPVGGFLDVTIEVFDLTTSTVVETATLPNLNLIPRFSVAGLSSANPAAYYWVRKIWELRNRANWNDRRPNGQPWSHDLAVSLSSLASTTTPVTARVPLSAKTWNDLRTSGHIYSVRVSFTDNQSGNTSAVLAVGPMTARVEWGIR